LPGELLYLDSSAIVKLVLAEPETQALRGFLRTWPDRVSSVVTRVEVERAVRRIAGGPVRRARNVLSRLALIEFDEAVVRAAATVQPTDLRTLDAIHLATALTLGDDLGALCAYDARLGDAATLAGIHVVAPA
jgi:predicted nucleic acid-binding protein